MTLCVSLKKLCLQHFKLKTHNISMFVLGFLKLNFCVRKYVLKCAFIVDDIRGSEVNLLVLITVISCRKCIWKVYLNPVDSLILSEKMSQIRKCFVREYRYRNKKWKLFNEKIAKKHVVHWKKPTGKKVIHVNNLQGKMLFDHSDY